LAPLADIFPTALASVVSAKVS